MPDHCPSCPFAGCDGCAFQSKVAEALRPLLEFVMANIETLERVDRAVTTAGERMAEEVENYVNKETR